VTKYFPPHPSEELLEEYFFHRLAEAQVAQIEEHLLTCEACRIAVQELDAFILTMKAEAARPTESRHRNMPIVNRIGVASTVALLLVALVVFRTRPVGNPAPAEVMLSSIRGLESRAEAPAGKPLQLNIEAPDLVSSQAYRIAVVDAAGGVIWTGAAMDAGGKISAQEPKRLASGMYWIRLYDSEGRQLREFGMSVK